MKNPRDRVLIAAFLLVILLLFYSMVAFSTSEPALSAKSAALYEPSTNVFLYSKNGDTRLPMASTTKIMTALVAIENYPLDETVTISDNAVGIEGSSLYLKSGEAFTMQDLLTGLMLRSANDAAVAIAYAVSGGIDEFANLMNRKAEQLCLTNTHFTNPHGLDDPEHYTTAKELAIISAEAMKNETFREIVSKKSKTITNENGESRLIANHNKLLSLYEGAIGVKTGFTKRCGRCLVGACERDGLSFISVTINAPDDWNDHSKLFDYGYSKLMMRHVAAIGEYSYKIPVISNTIQYLNVSNSETLDIITKKDDKKAVAHTKLMRYAASPVKKGDVMGKIIFTIDGKYVGEINLIAENDITLDEKKNFFSIF